MLYQILVRMIERENTIGLSDKIDVFFAVGRLTQTEYQALVERLSGEDEEA